MVELTASGDAGQVEARLREALERMACSCSRGSTMRPGPARPVSRWKPTSC
jgi:hypothetical protein